MRFVCFLFLTECLPGSFFVSFMDHLAPLLLEPTARLSFANSQKRGQYEKNKWVLETKQQALATEKMIAMLLINLDENTDTEHQNNENDSHKMWLKSFKFIYNNGD